MRKQLFYLVLFSFFRRRKQFPELIKTIRGVKVFALSSSFFVFVTSFKFRYASVVPPLCLRSKLSEAPLI